jgi:hypothetical protein
VVGLGGTEALADPPLRRSLSSYFVLAQRSVSGKDIRLLSPCNIGVNCAQPSTNASCGVMSFEDAFFADGSQVAGDKGNFNKQFADAFQVFVNKGAPFPNLLVRHPPIETFATPILPGTCGAGCKPDFTALGALCGMPSPFPACASGNPVSAEPGEDCYPAPVDEVLGNARCDLGPGTYGAVRATNDSEIRLTGGVYNVCSFTVSRDAVLSAGAPAKVHVANAGEFRAGNGSKVGAQCGDVEVFVQGEGTVTFGKNASIAVTVCAPESSLALGNNNNILGQFVADTVTADRGNVGRCCGGGCACFDEFSPTSAGKGDVITFTSHCSLDAVTGIRICGAPAQITSQTASTLTAVVPNVPPGACVVEAASAAGVFKGLGLLTVQ